MSSWKWNRGSEARGIPQTQPQTLCKAVLSSFAQLTSLKKGAFARACTPRSPSDFVPFGRPQRDGVPGHYSPGDRFRLVHSHGHLERDSPGATTAKKSSGQTKQSRVGGLSWFIQFVWLTVISILPGPSFGTHKSVQGNF